MNILIESVTPESLPILDAALQQLSTELGDTHRAERSALQAALFGTHAACHAIIARRESEDAPMGAALFSPVFSTNLGCAGVYVSDLWVSADARGQSLGKRLLANVADQATQLWQAGFIRLIAYTDNQRALAFYAQLGFKKSTDETGLTLRGDRFHDLGECR